MTPFKFYTPVLIRYMDLDPQWHVNNSRFLSFLETARMQYLIELKLWDGIDFFKLGLIVARVELDYLAPIKLGQSIRVGARVSRMGSKSMDFDYQIEDAQTGRVMATGLTPMVCYDYHKSVSIPVPDEWRKIISAYEGIPAFEPKK